MNCARLAAAPAGTPTARSVGMSIDPRDLERVTGGAPLALPAPPARLALPPPYRPPAEGMGFPKYSAGWWDLVRKRGLPG